jgi:hypothetical protein
MLLPLGTSWSISIFLSLWGARRFILAFGPGWRTGSA